MADSAITSLSKELAELVTSTAKDAGKDLVLDVRQVEQYAAARMQHLATAVGQPGFRDAVIAEADNVMLEAAGVAIDRADAVDARILGIVQGALAIGSRALALAL